MQCFSSRKILYGFQRQTCDAIFGRAYSRNAFNADSALPGPVMTTPLRILEGSVDATEKLRTIRGSGAGRPTGSAVVQASAAGSGMKIHVRLLAGAEPINLGLGMIDPDTCVKTQGSLKST
jgi:hypothetical protein